MSRRADETRRRLAEAALETFAERGFHGASTRDVAAAAGMSPAAVYVHYPSKEDLLYTLSRAGHVETLTVLTDAVESSSDPVVQLVTAVGAFVRFHATRSTHAHVVNYELAHLEGAHREDILRLRRQIDATMRGIVERGAAQGVFDVDDVRLTAVTLLSLGVDVARWYRPGGPWDPDALAAHYRTVALRVVGAAPGSA